jgi:hypothetical protein
MNPQAPVYPAGVPSAWAPSAPAGTTIVPPPPAYAPPQPPLISPPASPAPRRAWIAVWTTFAIAVLLAAAATALSAANLKSSAPTTTTVTAAPPSPTFSPEQIATAKTDVCDASINADKAIAAAQRHFFDAARDRHSPEYRPALNNYQLVASIETAYLERHIGAAVPQDVKDATNSYIAAEIALVEANTRELSDQDAQTFVVAARDSGAKLDKVCE